MSAKLERLRDEARTVEAWGDSLRTGHRESAHERALDKTRKRKAIVGPTITCAQCDGLGVHGLHPAHLVTWGALGSDWRTTEDVRKRLGNDVQPTALINRLQQLRRWGLVEVRHSAKNFRRLEWCRVAGVTHAR